MREPGIYELTNAEYHSDRAAIGSSGLKAMLESPAYYFGQYLDQDCPPESETETPSRRFGNLVHCHLFEPHLFGDRYRVGPDCARNLKEWKDWAKDHLPDGCDGIKPGEYKAVKRARQSVMELPDMAAALAVGKGEVSAYWRDEATGVLCKVRPDWVHPVGPDSVILVDGKTYASADEAEFVRQAARMKYPLQAALYSDGYAAATGKRVLAFIFLVISDDWPHLANAVMLDEASLAAGRAQYRRALDAYAECRRTGVWPGHGSDVKVVTLPRWALEA